MRLTRSAGMIVLAVWLILYGLITAFNFNFPQQNLIMGIIAIIAGILVLLVG